MSLIKAYGKERLMMRTIGRAVRFEKIDFLPYRKEYISIREQHIKLGNDKYSELLMKFCDKVFNNLSDFKVMEDISFDIAIEEIIGYIALNGKDNDIPKVYEKNVDGVFLMTLKYHGKYINAFRPKQDSSNALSYGWNTFRTSSPLVPHIKSAYQLNVERNHAVEKYHTDCNISDLKQILLSL